jgi:hypothetical protein
MMIPEANDKSNKWSTVAITSVVRLLMITILWLHHIVPIMRIVLPWDLMDWWNISSNLRSILINPVYTIQHINEAIAIRQLSVSTSKFVDAYRGQRIHIPPLVLAAMEYFFVPQHKKYYFETNGSNPWMIIAIVIFVIDLLIAVRLQQLTASILQRETDDDNDEIMIQEKFMNTKILPKQMIHLFPMSKSDTVTANATKSDASLLVNWNDLPMLIAHFYFVNPITILASAGVGNTLNENGCCYQNLPILVLLSSLVEACRHKSKQSSVIYITFTLAVATYMECHYAIFLIPILLWQCSHQRRKLIIGFYLIFTVVLQFLSILLVGSDHYISIVRMTHFYSFQLRGQSPSLSTLWYFSMEIFARFRNYFELLLGGLPYFLIAPITIRLYRYPSVLVCFRHGMNLL